MVLILGNEYKFCQSQDRSPGPSGPGGTEPSLCCVHPVSGLPQSSAQMLLWTQEKQATRVFSTGKDLTPVGVGKMEVDKINSELYVCFKL